MRPSDVEAGDPESAALFPLCLRLADVPCLVVGGGVAGVIKVRALLAAGARVRVVAPEVVAELVDLAGRPAAESGLDRDLRIEVVGRTFRPSDVHGQRLVVAATGREDVDRAVVEAAREEGVWAVAAGAPELGDALVPAVWRTGSAIVAVSTSGQSPTAAVWLRDRLANALPPRLAALIDAAGALREELRANGRVVSRAAWFRALDEVASVLASPGGGEQESALVALRAALEVALGSDRVEEDGLAKSGSDDPPVVGEADLTSNDGTLSV